MINAITVTNYLGESIKLELRFPEKSGFLIQDMTGLGPVKATINYTELFSSDGSVFNSSRIGNRNIVLNLRLMDKPDIETTRQLSYKYFPIKKQVHLLIETDNRICETYGYIETNDPVIFSKQEATQISILCPDPYFYSAGTNGVSRAEFSGVESSFEFPFENASLTDKLIQCSNVVTLTEKLIRYDGDAEIGINVYLHAFGTVTNPMIYNSLTHETMKIDTAKLALLTGSPIIASDDIMISTIKGKKSITLLRDGDYYNILNCLNRDASWFQLSKGDNIIGFSADSGVSNLQVRIENQSIYEGV